MGGPGFVYALINPSMTGLVKVGRTERDPTGRAHELSSATGVPTAFVLAFKRYFCDCVAAEGFVHAWLEKRGFRVAANREFFRAPLDDVVAAIVEAPGASSAVEEDEEGLLSHAPDPFLDSLTLDSPSAEEPIAWKVVFDEAEGYYYGFDNYLQDYSEALKLYKQCAKLGAECAYLKIGKMYLAGEGCAKDEDTALEYLKEGACRGYSYCYAEMALFFAEEHPENSMKCWDRFFAALPMPDEKLSCDYAYNYLAGFMEGKWQLKHWEAIVPLLPGIRDFAEDLVKAAREGNWECLSLWEVRLIKIARSIETGIPPRPRRALGRTP